MGKLVRKILAFHVIPLYSSLKISIILFGAAFDAPGIARRRSIGSRDLPPRGLATYYDTFYHTTVFLYLISPVTSCTHERRKLENWKVCVCADIDSLMPLSRLHEFITSSSSQHLHHPHQLTQQQQQQQMSSLTNNTD